MRLKYVLACLLLVIIFSNTWAQVDFEKEGDQFYDKKDYKNALPYYFRALHASRENPILNFKIGMAYLYSETKSQAVTFLEKAYKLNPEVNPDILYFMGMAYQSNHEYAKAKYLYENYKKRVNKKKWLEIDKKISECMISHALVNNPIDVIIENLGSNINSRFDDYSPVISNDGNTLIFTSKRSKDTVSLKPGYEDIYITKKVDGDWSSPVQLGNITRGHHDAASSISPDGKTMFLYYDDNLGDLYTSTLSATGEWSVPKALNKNINTPFRETHASISADGKKLFFSSTRPGGKGGLDIYMSELTPEGDWGRAVNLTALNTYADEDSPFIHADGVTIYFSSDGHPGMGSADIFKSNFVNGQWQKPENMGYPLNSIEYDGFFSISSDKTVAYFATRRKYGVGEYDILKATYRGKRPAPVEFKPAIATNSGPTKNNGVVTLYGKAFDKKGKQPLAVNISLQKAKSDKELAFIRSMPDGTFELNITEPGNYVLTAENDEYLFNAVNISVPNMKVSKIETNFAMAKPESGSIMVLRNLLFDSGKADLKSSSILELEKVRRLLMSNPELRVRINGHTDNVGDLAINKTLSLKRALAVVNYLALNGIDFERLSAKGYGAERPIASNDDEIGGRELNRRTEIEILEPLQTAGL